MQWRTGRGAAQRPPGAQASCPQPACTLLAAPPLPARRTHHQAGFLEPKRASLGASRASRRACRPCPQHAGHGGNCELSGLSELLGPFPGFMTCYQASIWADARPCKRPWSLLARAPLPSAPACCALAHMDWAAGNANITSRRSPASGRPRPCRRRRLCRRRRSVLQCRCSALSLNGMLVTEWPCLRTSMVSLLQPLRALQRLRFQPTRGSLRLRRTVWSSRWRARRRGLPTMYLVC